jgi:hypothetical protein
MKYIKTLIVSLVAVALLSVTAVAYAADTSTNSTGYSLGPWTLSLSGAGSSALNEAKIKSSTVGGEFELGHKGTLILPLDAGIRQSISYSDVTGNEWAFGTKVFSDWRIVKLGPVELGAGGNVGINYGNQQPNWTGAPEVVGRLYLKKDVDLFGRVEYPFNLNTASDEHQLLYKVGLRVRF